MNMTCKVAIDLAELYLAGVVSEESAKAIRGHLKTCAACRKYYNAYEAMQHRELAAKPAPSQSEMHHTEAKLYAELSRKLRRRHYLQIIGTSAAIGASTIMLLVGILLTAKGAEEK